ncbi:type II toxin-antitoxin system RelE/ParE family toxin [Inquilinus sp. OTU3971]|uniref:type II toxin-antitoxin system RelE/ParE family toxin n=1 Tax=Inquilinus sp. OTU3971 TaxID=3043855 RepID=UPI00313D0AEA
MQAKLYQLTPLAEADLEEIWLYTFRNWSMEQADSYHRDLVAAMEGLAAGRKLGRKVDVCPGYLKYAVGAHIVYFREVDAEIVVVRVLHGRMDVRRHL